MASQWSPRNHGGDANGRDSEAWNTDWLKPVHPLVPAKAGIQRCWDFHWIPAFAGTSGWGVSTILLQLDYGFAASTGAGRS